MIKDISMRILIAGASGAIGRPLVRSLKQNRHDVFALARSPESAQALAEMGAESVSADVLEAASVNAHTMSWTAIPRLRVCGFLRSPAQQTRRRPRKSRSRMRRHRPDQMRFTTRRVCAAHRTRKPVA